MVAGCSFSDYTKVDKVYGEILAEQLECEYLHEGSGCGSNDRIWRTVCSAINNGVITSKDLVVIQYTSLERREFWYDLPGSPTKFKQINLSESYHDGGSLVKFKVGSHTWARTREERALTSLYEQHFVSVEYESERFINQNLMFQAFLTQKKIPTIFLVSSYLSNTNCKKGNIADLFLETSSEKIASNALIWDKNITDPECQLDPKDNAHLSEYGHQVLADDLYSHVQLIKSRK